jgi:ribosomal protein S27AE
VLETARAKEEEMKLQMLCDNCGDNFVAEESDTQTAPFPTGGECQTGKCPNCGGIAWAEYALEEGAE